MYDPEDEEEKEYDCLDEHDDDESEDEESEDEESEGNIETEQQGWRRSQ